MEYINENDNRVSAALHITEVLKRGIFMLDEVVRGVANELENKINIENFRGLESNLPIFEDKVAIYNCQSYTYDEVAIAVFESLGFKYSSFKIDAPDDEWERLQIVVNELKNKPIYFQLQ